MGGMRLVPCPFCAGQAHIIGVDHRHAYRVRCPECGATGPKVAIQPWHRDRYIAQGQAAKAWNERKHNPLGHVAMIEFTERWPFGTTEMVALLNEERMTEADAVDLIKQGAQDYSPYLIVIRKEQYEKLFLNKKGGAKNG